MLNEHEIHEIERELARCRSRKAGSIEALNALQKLRGWISDDAIKDLSALLGMTPDELDSVATFYSLIFRKPVGRHVILICDSVVCWMTGGESLKAHLLNRLGIAPGQTTADNRFTLIPNACLGICDHAPALMIDDRTYTDLTPEKLDAILNSYE